MQASTASPPRPSPPSAAAPAAGALARLAAGAAPLRVLLVTAHPDDESLGASVLFSRAAEVHLLCLTDGAPRPRHLRSPAAPRERREYARVRRRELEAALAAAGVPLERLEQLAVPDLEAVDHLPAVAAAVAAAVHRVRPDLVVTHPYEGGHPDHDAAALAVARAAPGVPRAEMTSYHRAPGGGHTSQRFLPAATDAAAVAVRLTPAERDLRRRLLACHATQAEVLRWFPEPDAEHFRPAPEYDFAAPPAGGRLYYEEQGLGPGWAAWRRAAARLETGGGGSSP